MNFLSIDFISVQYSYTCRHYLTVAAIVVVVAAAVPSASRAFMTQFSRSMHVECWGTGVVFYVVTPFYVVSNLCKKKKGRSMDSPIDPEVLVEGTLAQLGKQFVWQVCVIAPPCGLKMVSCGRAGRPHNSV